jgi:NAD(P)-dependent dehydrogenase (short-subunit alcohol dehydrogenase family)
VINNAGVSPGLTQVTAEQMQTTYRANVVAPLMLIKALLPDIKNAIGKNDKCLLNKPMIVNVSSILGSIKFAKGTGRFVLS